MPNLMSKRMVVVAAFLGLVSLAAAAVAAPREATAPASSSGSSGHSVAFPGAAPWNQVPLSRVAHDCGLDP
jgi:hypothetical protein